MEAHTEDLLAFLEALACGMFTNIIGKKQLVYRTRKNKAGYNGASEGRLSTALKVDFGQSN